MLFAQHHWPVWGNGRVLDFLAKQRDCYKYLHDQTVRLMSHGLKAAEIAEQLTLPASLENEWSLRGYYGTLSHNVKAIYQRYLGWYDANAANLNPHPPRERSVRAVAYMRRRMMPCCAPRAGSARSYIWVRARSLCTMSMASAVPN